MEPRTDYIPPQTKKDIILDILNTRRIDSIKFYILYALVIGIFCILVTISDKITKHYTGSTKTIASLAIIIIPLAIIIYLYRKITKH